MLSALILIVSILVGAVLVWPRLANAPLWRATITPLASIIGSGFLVLGPILHVSYGGFAPVVMLVLCAMSYLVGGAIRYNIARIADGSGMSPLVERLELTSSAVLAFAFFVSVAYYLNLFGSFGVSLTGFNDRFHANMLTTAIFLLILGVGWTRGFTALERLEQVSVGLKLAIIAGLVFGLAVYFGEAARSDTLKFDAPGLTGWAAITLMGGLIVTVQGFETSRYLGATYDAGLRIRSMKLAQWISTVIYVIYISLITYAFDADPLSLDETAIIDLMQVVAPILPLMLVVAALSAQFSAAIADTSGSGGLLAEVSKGKISDRLAYALLVGFGILITWTADIFQIISYASRAFAAYYAIQSCIAALLAAKRGDAWKSVLFGAIVLVCAGIVAFGAPVE
tara:strand:+ start:190 stop:1380 length:1191 start_codon:yes stop_codon:yes gene_type:complete